MKLRMHILMFSLAIFVLAAVTMSVFYVRNFAVGYWLTIILIVAYACALALFVPPLTGSGKLSGKKIVLLTTIISIVAMATTNVAWVIATPKWSFSVVTNKTTYVLGENVEITVSLTNNGFITHSFKSRISNPVVVSIEYQYTENPTITYQVWYTQFQKGTTEFSVGPSDALARNFMWNQIKSTNLWHGEEIEPGIYQIEAFIPKADSDMPIGVDNLFTAWASINITST